MASQSILPGGQFIHPVRAHLADIRSNPGSYEWIGDGARQSRNESATASNVANILDSLDSNEARRFIVDREAWGEWSLNGEHVNPSTSGPARLAFPKMWIEFSTSWFAPLGEEPPVTAGRPTPYSSFLGFFIQEEEILWSAADQLELDTSTRSVASVTLFSRGESEDGSPDGTMTDTSFAMLLDQRCPAMSASTLVEANRVWQTDQSDMVGAPSRKGSLVRPRDMREAGAGWYERFVRFAGSAAISLLDYTTHRSTVFVNLAGEPTRQQRRADARTTAKGGHVPRPFHLVDVRPTYIDDEERDEARRGLTYQTDVRGHYRSESYRRLPARVLKDGTVKEARRVAVKSSWVPSHQRGPKDAPYIPSTYVVEHA